MAQVIPQLIKFPSIEAARNVFPHIERAAQFVRHDLKTKKLVYDDFAPLPTLRFLGTVKVHGGNCAVVQTRQPNGEKETYYQSRNKVLAGESDYMGFKNFMVKSKVLVDRLFKDIFTVRSQAQQRNGKELSPENIEAIIVYGEWCGGAVQKNIGLAQLKTIFIIFAVKIKFREPLSSGHRTKADDMQEWMDMSLLKSLQRSDRIFNTRQFPTYDVTIDFSDEKSKMDGLAKMNMLTLGVQEECPVAKQMGAKGSGNEIRGEGIVWQAVEILSKPALVAPNLKLEKFAGHGCWMKTTKVDGAEAALSATLPAKQHMPTQGSKDKQPAPNATVSSKQQEHPGNANVNKATASSTPFAIGMVPKGKATSDHQQTSVMSNRLTSNGISQSSASLAMALSGFAPLSPPASDKATNQYPSPVSIKSEATKSTKPSLDKLLSTILPLWRLEQGLQILEREFSLPREIRFIGPFIEWVVQDVFKEESDRIRESGIDRKQVAGAIAMKSTEWYVAGMEVETAAGGASASAPDEWW